MNWTGGRLRRQSGNRPDSISKIQKQHFARARIKQQESRQKARIALIEKPAFVFGEKESNESSRFVVDSQSTQSADRFSGGLLRHRQGDLRDGGYFGAGNNNNLETNSSIAYVDLLKKYLLDKKDWVGLSPTRPLQMKFTPIEEKERIGKRRKLSREDEARNTAMAKHATSFVRISSHADRPQSGGGLHNGADWNLKIHISSPKTMRRAQEYSESPIRSMSSDTMLSGFGEGDMSPRQNEESSHMPSNLEYEPIPNNLDSQTYRARKFDTSPQKTSADPTETSAPIRTSSIPVLHRFTLDDQVLAERLANSQMEAESSGSHPSDRFSAILGHGMFKHHDTFDNETLLGSSPRIHSEDRHTTISGSHKSYPTDSDTLPQTQKIQRQIPPIQSQMARSIFSEAQFKTPRVKSRLVTRPEPVVNTREPMTLFGQKVHSLSPEPSDKEANSTTSERRFQSNRHGYHMASPQPVKTPKAVHQTSALESVTKNPRPTSGFRFPNLWTPHRAIPQLSPYDEIHQKVDLTTSPIVSHRRPSPFISSLSQGNYRARQPLNPARSSLGKVLEDSTVIDVRDEFVNVPVFNTPFRR